LILSFVHLFIHLEEVYSLFFPIVTYQSETASRTRKKNVGMELHYITFIHLADAFIQSVLQ